MGGGENIFKVIVLDKQEKGDKIKADDAMIIVDDNGIILYANHRATTKLGLDIKDILNKTLDSLQKTNKINVAYREIAATVAEWYPKQYYIEHGDLHEGKSYHKDEYDYKMFINNLPIGIYRSTPEPNGIFLMANKYFCHMLGYSEEELLTKLLVKSMYINPSYRKAFTSDIIYHGGVKQAALQLKKKDGTIAWCLDTARVVYNNKGEVAYFDCIIEDITERKKAEQALLDSRQRMADIIDFLPDATFAIDKDGNVIIWNKAIEQMTGIRGEEIIGLGDYEYSIPLYKERRPLLIDLVMKPNAELEERYTALQKEGFSLMGESFCPGVGDKGAYLKGKASPLYDGNGNVIGAIQSIRDISKEKEFEANLNYQKHCFESLFRVN